MLTLRDHIGGDPVLRLGSPAKPLAEREKDARKRQQQAEQIQQMLAALGQMYAYASDPDLADCTISFDSLVDSIPDRETRDHLRRNLNHLRANYPLDREDDGA